MLNDQRKASTWLFRIGELEDSTLAPANWPRRPNGMIRDSPGYFEKLRPPEKIDDLNAITSLLHYSNQSSGQYVEADLPLGRKASGVRTRGLAVGPMYGQSL